MTHEQIDQLIQKIKSANSIAILMHDNPDGDAAGSAVAMYEILRKNFNKTATLFYSGTMPISLSFIPNISNAINIKNHIMDGAPDLAIAVDTAGLSLLKDGNAEIFTAAHDTVKIDHHPDSNDFAKLNINQHRTSNGEVIYNMAQLKNWVINKNAATAIYTAIISDTGFFRYIDEPTPLLVAANLITLGANPRKIAVALSATEKSSTLLEAQVVANAEFVLGGKLAIGIIGKELHTKLKGKGPNAINTLLNIDTVQCAALIREVSDNDIRISLRSKTIPVNTIAAKLGGGGGHILASGGTHNGSLSDARDKIISLFKSEFTK